MSFLPLVDKDRYRPGHIILIFFYNYINFKEPKAKSKFHKLKVKLEK